MSLSVNEVTEFSETNSFLPIREVIDTFVKTSHWLSTK